MDKSLEKERKHLTSIIKQWNESRLDLFAISIPDENLECHGVMRFYHKDSSKNGKYATKCIRVSSKAATKEVIKMLTTKFRPDMRMLTKPTYVINEVHVDGEMRQLNDEEKPLLVQLSWVKDDREGRFLLHNKKDIIPVHLTEQFYGDNTEDSSFKLTRTLTKKEKRLKKKQEKASKKDSDNSTSTEDSTIQGRQREIYTVTQLYTQVPESTFTRTVSNPEAVMKKRREQKLQKRGANILKVYGDRINPEIPYKSLYLLPTDDVTTAIRDAMDKYGLGKESVTDYRLIQVVLPPNSKPEEMLNGGWGMETVLADDQCPLTIEQSWLPHKGTLVFQLRHIAKDSQNTNGSQRSSGKDVGESTAGNAGKKKAKKEKSNPNPEPRQPQDNVTQKYTGDYVGTEQQNGDAMQSPPKFLEFVNVSNSCKEHPLSPSVTEIGSDHRRAAFGPYIELQHPSVQHSHCVVANMDGVATITPQNRSEVFVDGKLIEETTMLTHGSAVWIGRNKSLVFCEPGGKISVPQVCKKIQATVPNRLHQAGGMQRPDNARRVTSESLSSTQFAHVMEMPKDPNQRYHPSENTSRGPSSMSDAQSKPTHVGQLRRPDVLPASIQLRNGGEETFLMEIVSVSGNNLHFKLSPAYALYLSLRDIVEVTPKSTLPSVLVEYLCTITDLLDQTIQLNSKVANELAFWMANSSELLNFVRHDRDLSPCTAEAQDTLAKTVQLSFRHLVQCMQRELFQLMPAFLSESEEDLPGGNHDARSKMSDEPTMYNVLHMLSSAMSLLRRCRVNAALTIQLFSQLFHFVNMWLFNEVVCKPEQGLCCRIWALKIRARLARVEAWAEKQGLELAADCHLARITQAMHLLQAPKQSAEDIAAISGTCFKLNSLQLRALLSQYRPSEGERRISNELIDKVVQVAQNTADELTRSDGREVQLEEDPDLQLPFLLPEDGYSCDVVHSVPSGLTDFSRPLVAEHLCAYAVNADSSGRWTVYFHAEEGHMVSLNGKPPPKTQADTPELATITFNKYQGGMGLSIVAARGARQTSLGIYIRSVVKGGAAFQDGRLEVGDQLVSVDGQSLVGLTQERAAEIMTKTGQVVTLTVAKKAALSHGLAPLLTPSPRTEQPTAVTHRRPGHHAQPRPKSEGYALQQQGYQPPPPSRMNESNKRHHQYAGGPNRYQKQPETGLNKSTPQLNEDVRQAAPTKFTESAPRPAMSMGNLQRTPERDGSKAKALDEWQRTWEAKRAYSTYQRNRAKSSSASVLTSAASPTARTTVEKDYNRRKQVESMITGQGSKVVSPRPQDHHYSPSPKYASSVDNLTSQPDRNQRGVVGHSIGNPNYDQLPPPPSPPPLSPVITKSDDYKGRVGDSPKDVKCGTEDVEVEPLPPPPPEAAVSASDKYKSQPKTAKVGPVQKPAAKSSTLPRHFSSSMAWEVDKQQQDLQDQLNDLRDEEIKELSAKMDSLTPLEKNRLNNLLKEREFQRRVTEESRKMFSDEDASDEDYIVPDRPDRDRLIRMQDDQEKEQEREKKKEKARLQLQIEQERLEKEARERVEADKIVRERKLEEKRRERIEMREYEERRFKEMESQAYRRRQQERRNMEMAAKQRKEKNEEEDEREEAERELLEQKLSQGKPSNFQKFTGSMTRHGRLPGAGNPYTTSVTADRNKPVMRETSGRGPRPVSDGYLLKQAAPYSPDDKTSPVSSSTYNVTSPESSNSPVKYVATHSAARVIGTQERYSDPRDRREAAIRREQSLKRKQQESSFMTFKDRQRLFSTGANTPVEKPRASKKLLEIENSLRRSQIS